MIKIKKILVATDFSEQSEMAYPVAQKIAAAFGGSIDFIHVIPTTKYLNESLKRIGIPIDMTEDVYPKIIKETEKLSDEAMAVNLKKENRGSYFVKIDRKPSDAIVEHARENEYDLIIMGARGRHGTHLIRGGTTEKVIRNSHLPVFCVNENFDSSQVSNILVPTDSSTFSFSSFPLAVALASTYNASLTLFHVIELYGSISEDIPRTPEKGELISIYEVLIERLNNYLSDTGADNIYVQSTSIPFENQILITGNTDHPPIRLVTKIEKGVSAHFEIENYAESNADLVILATHGHSGIVHLFLGSTAEKVARHVTKPVITVRPEKNTESRYKIR